MISASVPDSEPVLKLLLQKGADVNQKSKSCHNHKENETAKKKKANGSSRLQRKC